jgi:hypothetical protein
MLAIQGMNRDTQLVLPLEDHRNIPVKFWELKITIKIR